MQISKKLSDSQPLLLLLFLSLGGTLCLASSMHYLGMPFTPWFGVVSAGIIFAIYLLNRYTDLREDFANDVGKVLFFSNRKFLFQIALVSLCVILFILTVQRRLVAYPVVLVSIGILYSFRLIPWYSTDAGLHFRRLKEFVLMKNVLVAALWGASIFVLPAIFSDLPIEFAPATLALAAAIVVSTFSNTVFNDIRDLIGDRLAGNQTVPVLFGARTSYRLIGIVNLLWVAFAMWMRAAGHIGTPHIVFFTVLAGFPFLCIFLYKRSLVSRGKMDFLSEFDLLVFAAGMFLLA